MRHFLAWKGEEAMRGNVRKGGFPSLGLGAARVCGRLLFVGRIHIPLPGFFRVSRNLVGIAIQLSDSEEKELFVHDSMQVSPE